MITKRDFLGGAASAAAIAASGSGLVWPTTAQGAPLDLGVFNERYSDARAFAHALGEQGVTTLPISGDAGTLWYGALGQRVAAGQTRLAGMSTSMDLFILETLAREANLRVRFVAHHDSRGSRTLNHVIYADNHAYNIARVFETAGAQWPAALAAVLPHTGHDGTLTQHLRGRTAVTVATNVERRDDHPGMLVSWILEGDRR